MKLISFLILTLILSATAMANDFICDLTSADTIRLPPPRNRSQPITKKIKLTISGNSVSADMLGDWYKNFDTQIVSYSESAITAHSNDWDMHEMNPFEVGLEVDTIKVTDADTLNPKVTLKRVDKAALKKSWLIFYGEYSCTKE